MLAIQLEKGGQSQRDKLYRSRSTKLTIPPSFETTAVVYYSDHHALSTARFRHAGQLATTDTCYFYLLT